jgi:hypothetical protein
MPVRLQEILPDKEYDTQQMTSTHYRRSPEAFALLTSETVSDAIIFLQERIPLREIFYMLNEIDLCIYISYSEHVKKYFSRFVFGI